MTKVIAVANQKGGTGKTTTVRSLGSALAEMGQNVLMIDVDPQGSLGIGCAVDIYALKATLYEVLLEKTPLANIIRNVEVSLDLAPSNINLAAAELELVNKYRREDRLKRALESVVGNQYNFILLDCPPSLGLLTVNSLSAADSLLIPLACEFYAMVGLNLLLDTVQEMRAQINPDLTILGILPTRYDARTRHAREVLEQTKAGLGDQVRIFEPAVKETVRFRETPIAGESILTYASNSQGAQAYREVAKEILHGK